MGYKHPRFPLTTTAFNCMYSFRSPRPLWAAAEANEFAVEKVPHKGAGLRFLFIHLKSAINDKETIMRAKSFLSLIAITLIVLMGCAGSGGWKTIKTPTEPNYLFATGNAESQELQLAIDQATMAARTEIGRQLELKLNNLQKSFAEEVGATNPEINQLYSSTTKIVVSTQLTGSRIRESKYKEKKGNYQAVVLVEYPIGDANAALVEQIKKNQTLYTQFRASEGFKELEVEVEKYEQFKKQQGQLK